jgi:hypothetical protein
MGMFRPAGTQGSRGKLNLLNRLALVLELGVNGGPAGNTTRQLEPLGNRRLAVNR